MKKLLFIILAAMTLTSCLSPIESTIKKEVKKDLKERLKKPESLQDLTIEYCKKSITNDNDNTYVIRARYKARNSYNDLSRGEELYEIRFKGNTSTIEYFGEASSVYGIEIDYHGKQI